MSDTRQELSIAYCYGTRGLKSALSHRSYWKPKRNKRQRPSACRIVAASSRRGESSHLQRWRHSRASAHSTAVGFTTRDPNVDRQSRLNKNQLVANMFKLLTGARMWLLVQFILRTHRPATVHRDTYEPTQEHTPTFSHFKAHESCCDRKRDEKESIRPCLLPT